ncbi:cytidine deaminase [Lachnospiraceae bacterium 62-35]
MGKTMGKDWEETKQELAKTALKSMGNAYVPYSHFHVGAALLTEDGTVYTGVNIENSSYPAAICAERTAIFKAVSEGHRKFQAIAVCGGLNGKAGDYCTPCGMCRQVMREFCESGDFKILLVKEDGPVKEYTIGELLPLSFGPESLEG